MDYADTLQRWALAHGQPVPVYTYGATETTCTFLNQAYCVPHAAPCADDADAGETDLDRGLRRQRAAARAYAHCGVLGRVKVVGFVPHPRTDRATVVDVLHAPPGALTAALRHALVNEPVTAVTPAHVPMDRLTAVTGVPYTELGTVHPGPEAYWSRLVWFLSSQLPVWQQHGTVVHLYTHAEHAAEYDAYFARHGVTLVLHTTL